MTKSDPPPGKYALCGKCYVEMEELPPSELGLNPCYHCYVCGYSGRLFDFYKKCPHYSIAARAIRNHGMKPVKPIGG